METGSKVKRKRDSENRITISLLEAKKYLGSGDITDIASTVGVTTKTVSNVIYGRSTNWAVAEEILKRAEHNKSLKQRSESF
jgi:hypothetical protein